MAMLVKSRMRKHDKGQSDHVDAWLMSYADLITLLFMMFVIFVSVAVSKQSKEGTTANGEHEHRYLEPRSGTLALGTPFDEAYRTLVGIVVTAQADQYIAVEKSDKGITVDISASHFFERGSADIPLKELPLLQSVLRSLKHPSLEGSIISVEGHTNDEPLTGSRFANNWELSAMRSAHLVQMLSDGGIDPARLRAVSYGGYRPLVPNRDVGGHAIPENKERNQRIVVRVEIAPKISLL